MRWRWKLLLILSVATVLAAGGLAVGCPFCSAVSRTLSEEMDAMDVVAVVHLAGGPPSVEANDPDQAQVSTSTFNVVQVLKGESHLGEQKSFETLMFGTAKPGQMFLAMANDPPKLAWTTPMAVDERTLTYIKRLAELPDEPAQRLLFFLDYFEDRNPMLAQDAYDEFGRTPYEGVVSVKEQMPREQLLRWIDDPDVPANRRRLYLTMLGICGTEADVPKLERMLQSDDRAVKAGLDALIAAYLKLVGPRGMPLVERLFLADSEAEYADTYAAVMALRFHGSEDVDVIPRARIVQAMHHLLKRPALADLVIPDLARWEDWSAMDQLVTLFKQADEDSIWVRVPVVNYMRVCPLPAAAAHLEQFKKIDPKSVEQATIYFPGASGSIAPPSDDSSSTEPAGASDQSGAVSTTTPTGGDGPVAEAAPRRRRGDSFGNAVMAQADAAAPPTALLMLLAPLLTAAMATLMWLILRSGNAMPEGPKLTGGTNDKSPSSTPDASV